jgi:predicted solute-binding protein
MGAKSEELARQFEALASEVVAVVETLSDADWMKVTEAERWTVGVTAHHLAGAFEGVARWCAAIASGQSLGDFTGAMIDEMNARHAKEQAHCTKAETIALLRKGAAAAAAVILGLTDDQLAMSARVFTDTPPMTVEQLVTGGLIIHIEEHVSSIRKTVGT